MNDHHHQVTVCSYCHCWDCHGQCIAPDPIPVPHFITGMTIEPAKGLRYNSSKPRLDLISPIAELACAAVLAKGAEKYAERNWEKGMGWMTVVASLKRHLNAFQQGEDFDAESGLPHIDHVLCNAMFLSDYWRSHPEDDDRPKRGQDEF